MIDDADAVGHFFGFFDVMRSENDGDPRCAQGAHQLPHLFAQLDVDARGRLVEKQDLRLVRQRLGNHQPAFHAAGQHPDLVVSLVP